MGFRVKGLGFRALTPWPSMCVRVPLRVPLIGFLSGFLLGVPFRVPLRFLLSVLGLGFTFRV